MKLMHKAVTQLKPLADEMIKMVGDKLTKEEIENALSGMLSNLNGKRYGVALSEVTTGTVERLKHDLSQGRVNINIRPSSNLLEHISTMQPERADKYRQFIAFDRIGNIKQTDRPTIEMESLSNVKTFTLLYHPNENGGFSIVGVVVLYGSSLTSWAAQSGLKRSRCDLSQWPSTHYLENPEHFVKCFQ